MTPKQRVCNTASKEEVAKVVRANLDGLHSTRFSMSDLDVVCGNYKEFLADLLKLTPRPSRVILTAA